jgi:pimeloyl-ACP methyl ester carboxylesterase
MPPANTLPTAVESVDIEKVTREVDVNGRTFPVIDAGEGPVVFMTHGFPDSRRMWRYQVPALTDAGFRVVAPDLRGFGDAPKPEDVDSYELGTVIEEDVIGLMDAMDIETARFVGHDWGGQVAWLTTAAYPERVEQLVALTAGAPGNSGYSTVEQMGAFWHVYFFQFEDAAEAWIRHDDWQFFRDWCKGGDDIERYIEQLSRPGALTAALNWYRANIRPQPPAESVVEYPDVTCPVMGVLAEDDAYLRAPQMRRSTERIDLTRGSWRYETVPNASHWLTVDEPLAVNRLLVDFLSE